MKIFGCFRRNGPKLIEMSYQGCKKVVIVFSHHSHGENLLRKRERKEEISWSKKHKQVINSLCNKSLEECLYQLTASSYCLWLLTANNTGAEGIYAYLFISGLGVKLLGLL